MKGEPRLTQAASARTRLFTLHPLLLPTVEAPSTAMRPTGILHIIGALGSPQPTEGCLVAGCRGCLGSRIRKILRAGGGEGEGRVLGLSSPPPAESPSQPPDAAAPFPEQPQKEDKGFFLGLLVPLLTFFLS